MDKGEVYSTNNYGELVVLKYIDSKNVLVRFLQTGYETIASAYNIRSGSNIRDRLMPKVCGIGFSGEGEYSGIKDKAAYKCWESMLYRCYDVITLKASANYEGCTVCTEWHNFQTFAKWYYKFFKTGYQLDKDKLVRGNKLYSPKTCCFIYTI